MKLVNSVLLPAFAYSAKIRPTCDTAPAELGQGTWSCPAGSSWNHGDTCTISGDGCSGTVKCKKGRWAGKTHKFCPKNCEGMPENPDFGGSWSCSSSHHSSCVLNAEPEFNCNNGVTCNTKNGEWKGRVECRYNGDRLTPPETRPAGTYSCNRVNKCRFTCDDGTDAGRAFFDWRTSEFSYFSNWYFCCPAPSCANGVAASHPPTSLSYCPDAGCVECYSGYEMDGSGNCVAIPTTSEPSTTLYVVPGNELSFTGDWSTSDVGSSVATGVSYAGGVVSYSESPTMYYGSSIDVELEITKSQQCSDHVFIFKSTAGKPQFSWWSPDDQVTGAWNCDYMTLYCQDGSYTSFYSPELTDYDWRITMGSSGVAMYLDGVLRLTCDSAPSWMADGYYMWAGADSDLNWDGTPNYGNYVSVAIDELTGMRSTQKAVGGEAGPSDSKAYNDAQN